MTIAAPLYVLPSIVIAYSILLFPAVIYGDVPSIIGFWAVSITSFTLYFYLLVVLGEYAYAVIRQKKS